MHTVYVVRAARTRFEGAPLDTNTFAAVSQLRLRLLRLVRMYCTRPKVQRCHESIELVIWPFDYKLRIRKNWKLYNKLDTRTTQQHVIIYLAVTWLELGTARQLRKHGAVILSNNIIEAFLWKLLITRQSQTSGELVYMLPCYYAVRVLCYARVWRSQHVMSVIICNLQFLFLHINDSNVRFHYCATVMQETASPKKHNRILRYLWGEFEREVTLHLLFLAAASARVTESLGERVVVYFKLCDLQMN